MESVNSTLIKSRNDNVPIQNECLPEMEEMHQMDNVIIYLNIVFNKFSTVQKGN